jgi:hypothetical protein
VSFWNREKTFRPQRAVPESAGGGKGARIMRTVHATMKQTLGAGDLAQAVKCPAGEDINEWLAVNTVQFFNAASLIFGTVQSYCTNASCPVMAAGKASVTTATACHDDERTFSRTVRVQPTTRLRPIQCLHRHGGAYSRLRSTQQHVRSATSIRRSSSTCQRTVGRTRGCSTSRMEMDRPHARMPRPRWTARSRSPMRISSDADFVQLIAGKLNPRQACQSIRAQATSAGVGVRSRQLVTCLSPCLPLIFSHGVARHVFLLSL